MSSPIPRIGSPVLFDSSEFKSVDSNFSAAHDEEEERASLARLGAEPPFPGSPDELAPQYHPPDEVKEYTEKCLRDRPYPPYFPADSFDGFQSEGPPIPIIPDEAIVCIFKPVLREEIGNTPDLPDEGGGKAEPLYAERTPLGNWVIQQNGRHLGSGPACLKMLLFENKISSEQCDFMSCRCGAPNLMRESLTRAGINHSYTELSQGDLIALRDLIWANGPAYVTINLDRRSHTIIVDHVGPTNTILRDPNHGWQCLVSNEFLIGCIEDTSVIQLNRD